MIWNAKNMIDKTEKVTAMPAILALVYLYFFLFISCNMTDIVAVINISTNKVMGIAISVFIKFFTHCDC